MSFSPQLQSGYLQGVSGPSPLQPPIRLVEATSWCLHTLLPSGLTWPAFSASPFISWALAPHPSLWPHAGRFPDCWKVSSCSGRPEQDAVLQMWHHNWEPSLPLPCWLHSSTEHMRQQDINMAELKFLYWLNSFIFLLLLQAVSVSFLQKK